MFSIKILDYMIELYGLYHLIIAIHQHYPLLPLFCECDIQST